MEIDDKDLEYCLTKARELAQQYQQYVLGWQRPEKSLDDLLWICGQYLNKNVAVYKLSPPLPRLSIRGFYVSADAGYTIVLHGEMNYCWTRFVLCKELFHVVLDNEKYRSVDLYEHISALSAEFSVSTSDPPLSLVSEALAEVAAMEFMFPYVEREQIAKTAFNSLAVADKYKVPQFFVEKYLSEHMMKTLEAYKAK